MSNFTKLRYTFKKNQLNLLSLPFSTTSHNLQNQQPPPNDPMTSVTNLKTSYSTTYSNTPLVTKTIAELLEDKAHLTKPVFTFPHQNDFTLSYQELNERVDTAAQNLLELGFNKGDRLAIILPNTIELAVAYFAASKLGLITTMLNPAYQLVEIEFMLGKSGAKGVIMYDSFKTLNHLEVIKKICPELEKAIPGELDSKALPMLKHVILVNSPFETGAKTYKGTWNFSRIGEKKSSAGRIEVPYTELDDPNLILFTSGTTGKPKGALMSQTGLLNSCNLSIQSSGSDVKDVVICSPIPFFHIYGFSTGILEPMLVEVSKVFPFYFPETVTTMRAIESYQCKFLRGTPTQYFDILNHPDRHKYNLSSLKNAVIAGSTVAPDLLEKLRKDLKVDHIYVGYGMTETSLCHSETCKTDVLRGDKYAYESCGRGLPYTESKIVDPSTGRIQPLNTDGELHIRGPHIIKKYWDEPEKTAETIDKNGWLKTGDIFSMDEEGYLFFKSRNKDIIIRGGANIYPAEVEAYLRTHPNIIGAEAFGIPNERVGEEVCAWIILKPNTSMSELELRKFCQGNISHFKIPRFIKFVDKFPVNANNKVLKNKMREIAIEELTEIKIEK